MMNSLGYRMEDTGEANFGQEQKLIALNDAQRQVVSMLTNDALVHLQVTQLVARTGNDANFNTFGYFDLPTGGVITGVLCTASTAVFTKTNHGLSIGDTVTLSGFLQASDDASYSAINGLTTQVAAGTYASNTFTLEGVDAAAITTNLDEGTVQTKDKSVNRIVAVYDKTNERFTELTTIYGLGDNKGYTYGTKTALFNNRIYAHASNAVQQLAVVYITSPSDILDTATEITYLSDSAQQAIVEIAESLLWRQDNRQNRATAAANNAAAMIQAINGTGV
tara:strand:- start:221 stop:1057 length:837 start_codon:yes stop_codon:yes gene_type:complete